MKRAVLLIGFGGPEKPGDIRPFLANVLRGRPVPPHRVDEVVAQYERIGGRSPYTGLAQSLAQEIEARLSEEKTPVVLGMRNWAPTLADTLSKLQAEGVTDIVGVVLAAYRSIPSWNYYLRSTADAFHSLGGRFRLRYVSPWHDDPRFEDAVAQRVQEALAPLPPERRATARWFFTAHSIPTPWSQASGYSEQLGHLASRVAGRFGQLDWRLVFQSRSGRPEDPWLEPDVAQTLSESKDLAGRDVLLIPIGFLMDHVEVLFDLDVKAKQAAEQAGATYHRAKTVGLHPRFLDLLVDRIRHQFTHLSPLPLKRRSSARQGKHVVVVGAGIAGLSAAHRLVELSQDSTHSLALTVLDAGDRPGGVVDTGHREGFLWEGGPDSFITEKPAALALARRLGMEKSVIGTNRQFQQSFVAKEGRLLPTPEGFYLLAPSKLGPLLNTQILSWRGKLRAGCDLFIPRRKETGDESLASFVRRRFGRETLERLAQPMVAGIYSADPETLSLQATFPRFLEMEAKHGSVIRALLAARKRAQDKVALATSRGPRYGLFAAFENGVHSFVQVIVNRLPPGSYEPQSHVTRLERIGARWRITVNHREALEADAVVLAVPVPVASRLLWPLDAPTARLLATIHYGDVATLNVAVRLDRLGHPLNGFGFVVPAREGRTVTGVTFSSVKFPGRAPHGYALLRAFVGGGSVALSDAQLRAAVMRDLRDYLRLKGEPEWIELRRYPGAMPQYTLGHVDRVREITTRIRRWSGLALAGNGYNGIGLPDCVFSGETAAERVFESLRSGIPPEEELLQPLSQPLGERP